MTVIEPPPTPVTDRTMAMAMAVRALVRGVDSYRGARAEAAGGVAVIDIVALGHLLVQGPQTPTDLARRLGVTTASITDLLDRMEQRRWVLRTPHPRDRRRILASLTEVGHDLITETYREFATRLSPAFTDLPSEDQQVVMRFLETATSCLTGGPQR
ncbi:MarR family winged helix-turn-helix transcriptional regulator [Nocardia veterana]|uniref:MarR family transcriptional regulator n=1 Tax=Nocardia veterana TaxID=132249 RepID=A0A7X6LWY6_9NOCA|nr:MarR family transcriptional regulator [Nocardia veterana]NKY86111.1 MarR family transcriptional regulator [Nocardia veterana]